MPPDILVSRGSKARRPWCRRLPKGLVTLEFQPWTRRVFLPLKRLTKTTVCQYEDSLQISTIDPDSRNIKPFSRDPLGFQFLQVLR